MKDFLLGNPTVLGVLGIISIIYVLLLFHFSCKNKKVELLLKRASAIAFFFVMPQLNIAPFDNLHITVLQDTTIRIMAIVQIGLYGTTIFILALPFQKFFKHIVGICIQLIKSNPFLWSLIFLSLLSTNWSGTPRDTFQASFVLVIQLGFALYFGTQNNWQELSLIMRWSLTLLGFLSTFYAVAKPDIGVAWKGWTGVVGHPNLLGTLMGFNAALWWVYVAKSAPNRGLAISVVGFSIFVMQMANSAGAFVIFVFLVGILNFLKFIKKLRFQYAFTACILVTIVALMSFIWISENLAAIATALGKDLTFTGRTDIWPRVIHEVIAAKPVLGWGYRGFWQEWRGDDNPALFMRSEGWQIPHSHNGYLDLAVDLGVVGLFLFILSLLKNIIDAVHLLNRSQIIEATMPMMIVLFLALKNIPETGIWSVGQASFLYMLITVRLGADNFKGSLKAATAQSP